MEFGLQCHRVLGAHRLDRDSMAKKLDKIILTNQTALTAKYGVSGMRAIRAAINRLIEADANRGLTTRLIALDDAAMMRRFSARPVTNAGSARQNKEAVDALYAALAPDYILLLGSVDVIPQQPLKNPVYDPHGEDTDHRAAGDLPYACETGYSNEVTRFLGPTRVLGRLPDAAGASEPSFLLQLLKTAAGTYRMPRSEYQSPFVITAQIWEASTRQSMRNIFGNSDGVMIVPPRSGRWPAQLLQRRLHLVNCHGAYDATEFFGQPASGANEYPIALRASYIDGQLTPGTVAAAECCYGGQLEGVSASRPRMGICETYLKNGCWGFVGSSTVAYGDFERNANADLLCQFFLEKILGGASLGRAFLEARQRFVRAASPLNPFELKTLAQFSLYGDPSVVAVDIAEGKVRRSQISSPQFAMAQRSERHNRRRSLFKQGVAMSEHEPIARRISKCVPWPHQALVVRQSPGQETVAASHPVILTVLSRLAGTHAERAQGGFLGAVGVSHLVLPPARQEATLQCCRRHWDRPCHRARGPAGER